jgi:hypothetical protein
MPTPPWWQELVSSSDVLAAEDRDNVRQSLGDFQVEGDRSQVEGVEEDELPLTFRLAYLARAFAQHAHELTREQRRQVLRVVEQILRAGSEYDRTAVATGFFEALLSAADEGFDLRLVWDDMGPESRAYCLAWNEFTGVESPDWMKHAP